MMSVLKSLGLLAADAVEAVVWWLAPADLRDDEVVCGGRGGGKDVGERAESSSGANVPLSPASPPPTGDGPYWGDGDRWLITRTETGIWLLWPPTTTAETVVYPFATFEEACAAFAAGNQ